MEKENKNQRFRRLAELRTNNVIKSIRILANCSNIIVENQNCSDGSIGIILGFSNNITVRNNTFYGNNYLALKLSNSNLNNIINNTFMFNAGGIYLWDGSNSNNIINNTFHDIINSEISLWDSNRNSLINNKCMGRWGGIILRNSSFSTIINNTCKNTYGISIDRSNSSLISNNKLISSGFWIYGNEISHWNTHTLDLSNSVNGKPIFYWKNIKNVNLNNNPGQIILANCSNIKIH